MAAYLAERAETRKLSTVQASAAAIAAAARAAGRADPTKTPLVADTLRGIARQHAAVPEAAPRQAAALDYQTAVELLQVAARPQRRGRGRESPSAAAARGRRDGAIVALAFCAGLRRSEIVALRTPRPGVGARPARRLDDRRAGRRRLAQTRHGRPLRIGRRRRGRRRRQALRGRRRINSPRARNGALEIRARRARTRWEPAPAQSFAKSRPGYSLDRGPRAPPARAPPSRLKSRPRTHGGTCYADENRGRGADNRSRVPKATVLRADAGDGPLRSE